MDDGSLKIQIPAIFDPDRDLAEAGFTIAEQDERANKLAVVDFGLAKFEICLRIREHEVSLSGEEKLRRLRKKKRILLGGNQYLALWQNYRALPSESVLSQLAERGIKYVDFFGTILNSPDNRRCVLFFAVAELAVKVWYRDVRYLSSHWSAFRPTVTLDPRDIS